jgi:membrane fusion protein (multidrug efflux system)
MKRIDRRILIVASMLFIVGLSYGIMKFLIAQKEEPPTRKSFETLRFVQAEITSYKTLISPVSEPGRMASVSEINMSAEASGKILQGDISLKKGVTFSKGEIVFSIYRDEAVLALKAKKSQFLNTLALMLPDIAIDYPDYEDVFFTFFSSIDINDPLPNFPKVEDDKLTIFLAGKNVLSSYYDIQKDELQLSRHVVRAPFSGTLSEVFMEVGAYTNTGGTVARAIRTDALELEVPLRRGDAGWVKIGDPVQLSSDNRPFIWEGTVLRKSQIVDENTQSQRVYVRVNNHKSQPVLAGEFLTATFPGRPIEGVMEIPRNAVFNTNEVFVVKEKRLQKQIIDIKKVNTRTLLFSGLEEGDTLIVQPLINVFEGTKVTTSLDKTKPKKAKNQ